MRRSMLLITDRPDRGRPRPAVASTAKTPAWTFPPAGAPTVGGRRVSGTGAPPAERRRRRGHGKPSRSPRSTSASRPTTSRSRQPARYAVTLKNTGAMPHDLTFPDGTTTGPVEAGKSATVEVDVPAGGLAFMCSHPRPRGGRA